ncbi:MAG TPA: bifunctional phosphopantothenoylcysteine decarboxylase/phosphopantothenate--cysteine ligase CoaBC [Candidatus Eisenbacteria bacterium]|nr:bifunctional phosphopantothenoylcysteine decarboxylase/phosphopantothenate--cysteine ligase CoaBC [Candidatus Eisenbacteria bacterium]
MAEPLQGRTVLVGISGGIACYKACELVRALRQAGATVPVVMTRGAREFVAPLTLQTLSGRPVATETFDLTQESEIGHIRLADTADVVVIAPATANVIAKLAHGIADDLLTTVLLATRAPVLVAPAMNVHMWEHPATRENVATLAGRGVRIVGPAVGSLACGYEGAGRLAEIPDIVEGIVTALTPQDLAGERVLVSAGPTREAIDPVRYLTNHSSGKMGYAIARVARRRGAEVTLVSGPVALPPPPGVRTIPVESAREMAAALRSEFPRATLLVMAAAVADYRAARPAERKVKKSSSHLALELARNEDIISGLAAAKRDRVVVGFAAETHDLVTEARRKLREKRLDLVVANDVTAEGAGFGSDTNVVRLIDAAGGDEVLPVLPKDEVAARILDWFVQRRQGAARRRPAPVTRRVAGARAARRRSRRGPRPSP